MKQEKRILLYEIGEWNDYLKTLERIYLINPASNLPIKYLGKKFTKSKIQIVKNKIKKLNNKFESL